jgi:hypothetical protein
MAEHTVVPIRLHQNARDLTGMIFGRLTVVASTERRADHHVVWRCLCTCGAETFVRSTYLTTGITTSCGCLNREITRMRRTTHGSARHGSRTATYRSWESMKRRCLNPNDPAFARYGGRGITVCDRWLCFEHFRDDMGERPHGLSIDRFPNNDGNYEPGNCRWATRLEQTRNRRPRKH